MKRLLIFASGTRDGGGSGFEELVRGQKAGVLKAEIVAVASNHPAGGVKRRADALGVPFVHFEGPFDAEHYKKILDEWRPDFVALSGWLKMVASLDPRATFNIHPGPLPRFGGPGFYGRHVHKAVLDAYHKGEIKNSAISMFFVTEKYDEGPVFFEYPVPIEPDDTQETLADRVNAAEHAWQAKITDMVVNGEISWDGKDPKSLKVPAGYQFLPKP